MNSYTKDEVLNICRGMFNGIDKCVTNLVKSRLNDDDKMEQKTLCEMEKLICGIQQDLAVVIDYIDSE